jgi:hypothetical protein
LTQLLKSSSGPRELFSISQIEKAYGPAYEQGAGCVRAWGERYLNGLKEPEMSYAEALAMPATTNEQKRERSSYVAKSFGKALEAKADQFIRGEQVDFTDEPGRRFFPGVHLLPHPSSLEPVGGYELQAPVNIKLLAPESPEPISFQGFKDARFLPRGAGPQGWFLFDYKTTKPKVDNAKNRELGKPAGWWTWMKTPAQLAADYQWNLYEWHEYSTLERLVPSRWVYFAAQETPQARAVDMRPEQDPNALESVRTVVTRLASHGHQLRGYIRDFRKGLPVAQLPRNTSNCQAYGRICPYHRSQPGGECEGGDNELVPMGQLLAKPGAVTVRDFQIEEFQFNLPTERDQQMGTLRDQINAATQQMQNGQPAMQGPPQGQLQQAPGAFVPQGAPPAQAAYPSGFQGQSFAPAPGQAGFAGTPQGQQPHVGAPEGWQQPSAPKGMQNASAPPAYGTPSPAVQGWYNDGQGGVINLFQIQQHAQQGFPPAVALLDQPAPQAPAGAQGSQTQEQPIPGAQGPATTAPDAPKKRGRKTNAERAAAAGPAQSLSQLAPGEQDTLGENEEDADDLAAIGMLVVTLVRAVLGYGKQG